jgi:AraC-like DNA-binding protein
MHQIRDWPQTAKEAHWSVSALAKKCGVSVRTLERYFVKQMGTKPKQWLAIQRQLQASNLLRNGFSVKETSGFLHFKHPSHLTNGFKKHWGRSPTGK